jgi:hypothetical protein
MLARRDGGRQLRTSQRGLERAPPTMLQAVYGGRSPTQLVRDLIRREAQHVTEEEDESLLVGKCLERIAQRLAHVRILSGRRGTPSHEFVRGHGPAVTEVIESGVPGDAQKPGREGRSALVVALHTPEELHEDVLSDVLGVMRFMDDALDITLHVAREARIAVLRCSTIALPGACYCPPGDMIVASDARAQRDGKIAASGNGLTVWGKHCEHPQVRGGAKTGDDLQHNPGRPLQQVHTI